MGGRHMIRYGTVAALMRRALVARDPGALVKEFDDVRTQAHIELLLDQGVGH
jgi:hypothetical protein